MSVRHLAKYSPPSHRNVSAYRDGACGLRNNILLALPASEYALLSSKLTLINSELHDILQEARQQIKFAFFPRAAANPDLRFSGSNPVTLFDQIVCRFTSRRQRLDDVPSRYVWGFL
jgi:hypothetical protein